jgi:hypothetical protein
MKLAPIGRPLRKSIKKIPANGLLISEVRMVEGVTTMFTDMLTNPTVKAAIEALQKGDRSAWSALFEPDAKLYDDGSPRSLEKFTEDALGHERFTSIESVDNNGLDLVGGFHSEQWGDFRTYFRFQLSASGKIKRLDIGQAG